MITGFIVNIMYPNIESISYQKIKSTKAMQWLEHNIQHDYDNMEELENFISYYYLASDAITSITSYSVEIAS